MAQSHHINTFDNIVRNIEYITKNPQSIITKDNMTVYTCKSGCFSIPSYSNKDELISKMKGMKTLHTFKIISSISTGKMAEIILTVSFMTTNDEKYSCHIKISMEGTKSITVYDFTTGLIDRPQQFDPGFMYGVLDKSEINRSMFKWTMTTIPPKHLLERVKEYVLDDEVTHVFDEYNFIGEVWRSYKTKYSLEDPPEYGSKDPNEELITGENALRLYLTKIRPTMNEHNHPYQFEYDNGHNPSCGGTGVIIRYSSSLNVPYTDLITEIETKMSGYVVLRRLDGYGFNEMSYLIAVDSGMVLIDYDDNSETCAGHHVKIVIGHHTELSQLFGRGELDILVKQYLKINDFHGFSQKLLRCKLE
jgi:hypothetical protein